jgi:hypothetical protein
MAADEIVEELMIWRNCYPDKKDNFDARLLKKAADTINILLDKINELDIMYEKRSGITNAIVNRELYHNQSG